VARFHDFDLTERAAVTVAGDDQARVESALEELLDRGGHGHRRLPAANNDHALKLVERV
jgi:hypothetical protein